MFKFNLHFCLEAGDSMKFYVLIAALFAITSCSSTKFKDTSHMDQAEYKAKPVITESLIDSSKPMDEAAIQRILDGKIQFPKRINLAILRLANSFNGFEFQLLDQAENESFYKLENWGPRVQSIIPVPQLLISKKITIESLRHAAVLLQADALLVIKPISSSDWKFRWFDTKLVRGRTSLEVLLLDTRTSVIPFTGLVTETAVRERDNSDYGLADLLDMVAKESEAKALTKIAPAVKIFLEKQ